MWKKDEVEVYGKLYKYEAKVYGSPSEEYGLFGGRISKLRVTDENGKAVANYDRGWDVKPKDAAAECAVLVIHNRYNPA